MNKKKLKTERELFKYFISIIIGLNIFEIIGFLSNLYNNNRG